MKLYLQLLISLFTVATLLDASTGTVQLRPLNGTAFAEIGKNFSLECVFDKNTPVIWYNYSIVLLRCPVCGSPCKVNTTENPWGKAHATCDPKTFRSVLTLTNLTRLDHTDYIGCQTDQEYVKKDILVGSYDKMLHPHNATQVPVLDHEFALVCDIRSKKYITVKWFNDQGKITAYFIRCFALHTESTSSKYAPPVPGRNLTCNSEERTSTLTINPVEMSLDGTSVGCFDQGSGSFYLYTFNVHVPVETVEIENLNETDLIEGTEKNFVCLVGKSKPSPRIEWVINDGNSSSVNVTSCATVTHNASGKFFKSKSVLTLTLHRSFKTLRCTATVANLPWVQSELLELDVQPVNTVYIIIGCVLFVVVLSILTVFLCWRIKREKKGALDSNYGYHMIKKGNTT